MARFEAPILKRLFGIVAVFLLAALVATAGAAFWGWQRLNEPFQTYPGRQLDLVIESGSDAGQILELLESERVIRSAWVARLYLIYVLEDPPLKAGEYNFGEPMTPIKVIEKLTRGEVSSHSVTIIEGLDMEETARALADAGFGRFDRLLEEMRKPSRIEDLDPEAGSLEGYLFPDTYRFAHGTTEAQIVDTLVITFRRRLDQLGPIDSSELRGLVTLASIVESEAQLDNERALIAGVFSNRLARGIPLAADPTVIFAIKLEGRWDGNIRRDDLRIESPYNTYNRTGLPPGAICSPGFASLQAAFHPAETDNLYFVSRNDGSHVFAKTLSEHNRNVERWQRQYWRERWARERRERGD